MPLRGTLRLRWGPRNAGGPPSGIATVRRVKQAMPSFSERRLSTTMRVPRSVVRERETQRRVPVVR
jgi:hypothetical protein